MSRIPTNNRHVDATSCGLSIRVIRTMYVMQHHQLSWEDALHMVQNRRYCISPNGGFMTQIKVRAPYFPSSSSL